MRRNRFPRHPAVAVVGLLVLAGCSSGGDTKSLGPVPTAAPTTTEQTTTTTVPATTSTPARPATTAAPSTTVRPVIVNGIPQVTATPSGAAVGAKVRIEGTGFTDSMWRASRNLWLAPSEARLGCALYAQAEHTVTVSARGILSGDFIVPSRGDCRMGGDGDATVTPGTYRIVFTCTACFIGELRVTSSVAECADVAFAPNSDNLAARVVASNMGCAEAEALVRTVGAQVRSVGGPARVEADGFVCVRTSQSDGPGLPSSNYECTSGVKKVTFVRL